MSLTIKNLGKAFGEKRIFENFSYSFPDNGIYAIKGDSGVGKTTLLRIICGLDKNHTGCVFGGGFNNTSFSFQEYRLFSHLSALENITETVWENSNETNVSDAKKILFRLGFSESDLLLYPSELSGGMKQRVSLARAFLKRSPILILDEPTKELDQELCAEVREIIFEESKLRLVIMVTHNHADIEELNATVIDLNALTK